VIYTLQALERYPIFADDGISSCPFDVRLGMFGSVVRAVRRANYDQRAATEIRWRDAEACPTNGKPESRLRGPPSMP
jgi:hypothetical protein